jgi:hypothetical protein
MVSTSNLVTATSAADEYVASSDDLKASNDELDVSHRTLGLSERLGSADGERRTLLPRQIAFEPTTGDSLLKPDPMSSNP